MQTFKMSRESRKVFQTIDTLCERYGVQGEVTPGHIYLCEILMVRFYAQPVANIIKMQIGKVKRDKLEPKHFTFEYWVPVLTNMLSKNASAVRPTAIIPDWELRHDVATIESFAYLITEFLLVDYSYSDMTMVQKIVNTYTLPDIKYACLVAKGNRVYEPRYIDAVLSKEAAKRQARSQEIRVLEDKIEQSDKLLDKTVHTHTPLELASVRYDWDRRRENAKLERGMDDMIRRLGL